MKEIIYLDTYGDGGYSYEDYKEWCDDNEITPADEDSHLFLDWVQQSIADDIDCFFAELRYAKGKVQEPCIITGSLGLWWGHPEIEPVECENLADAVHECWGDCDYAVVKLKDGIVSVDAIHHDGTNHFEIRPKEGKYPKYLY